MDVPLFSEGVVVTGVMLSFMVDRMLREVVGVLAGDAGMSRSAWCRRVLQAAVDEELEGREQKVRLDAAAKISDAARQERLDRMYRNQGRAV